MKLMHVFYLIFPILIFSSSCTSNIPKKGITIYFQNNYFEDGPITWPKFHMYEELPDEAIRHLDDIFLAVDDFNSIEKNLLLMAGNSCFPKIENSINGYDENIYVIINQEDSIYFNKDNQFFSNNDLFISNNKGIAEYVRSIIKYRSYFSEEKKVSSIYSKVKIIPEE